MAQEEDKKLEQDTSASNISAQIEEIPPADGANVMEHLSVGKAAEVAEYLDPVTAGNILAEMEPQDAARVIEDMPPPEASMVLAAMPADDRVDVMEHVGRELHEELLTELPPATASEVRALEKFAPDTAGGIMNTQFTALPEQWSVEEAIAELRRLGSRQQPMFYTYVVDQRGVLRGVISMRDLILSPLDLRLHQIMHREVKAIAATMDQEKVADQFRKYNYLALPVVDAHNVLLGIVTVDDVVEIISEEAMEDVQRMAGAGAEERLTSPWHFSFRKRILWLEVNLATAFLAAAVVGFFEATIARIAILAVYMPVVAGMGGNASAQAMSVAIRGIALGEVDFSRLRHVLIREFFVGLVSGIVIGITTALVAWAFHSDHGLVLGAVVAVALVITMISACIAGVAIPFIMKAMRFDPAQSASIFITTVTDFVGFLSFLGLAWLFMK